MFRFNKTIIREPTMCASLKLQYWRQLKYFVIELFGRVAALCGAFIVIFNVNFNILKQFKCALVGQIKDLITSKCTVQL
jgi:hypothetical protein